MKKIFIIFLVLFISRVLHGSYLGSFGFESFQDVDNLLICERDVDSSQDFKFLLTMFFGKLYNDLKYSENWLGNQRPSALDFVFDKFQKSFDLKYDETLSFFSRQNHLQWFNYLDNTLFPKTQENICFNEIVYSQNLFIDKKDLLLVVGDIHGFSYSLSEILNEWKIREYIDDNFKLQENVKAVFLGDYVDRGENGLRVLIALMLLKLVNPGKVILLRGNHEEYRSMGVYGFLIVLIEYFGNSAWPIFIALNNCYELLTDILFVRCRDYPVVLQLNHGGLQDGYNPKKFIKSKCKYGHIQFDFRADLQVGFHWNDIYSGLMEDFIESLRGPGILVHDVHFVIENYMQKYGISCFIKGHDHYAPKIDQLQEKYKSDFWSFRQNNEDIRFLIDNYLFDFDMFSIGACEIGTEKNPVWITLACSPYPSFMNYKSTYLEVMLAPNLPYFSSGWCVQPVACSPIC